jgi:hypothetical protein
MNVNRCRPVFPPANVAEYGFRSLNEGWLLGDTGHALFRVFAMRLVAALDVDFQAIRQESTRTVRTGHQAFFVVAFISSVIIGVNAAAPTSEELIEVLRFLRDWPPLVFRFLTLIDFPLLDASFNVDL